MYISKVVGAVAAAAALFTSANAGVIQARAMTAGDVVNNINILTTKSKNLQTPAGQINLVNGALAIIGAGPVPVRHN